MRSMRSMRGGFIFRNRGPSLQKICRCADTHARSRTASTESNYKPSQATYFAPLRGLRLLARHQHNTMSHGQSHGHGHGIHISATHPEGI
jgi:hypothetical protein